MAMAASKLSADHRVVGDSIDTLANQPLPLLLNAVAVDRHGRLRRARLERMSFSFAFRGALIRADGRLADGRMTLALESDLGRLPFPPPSPAARGEVLAVLSAARTASRSFAVAANRTIRFSGNLDIRGPITQIAVLSELIAYLIGAIPVFDRLATILGPLTRGPAEAVTAACAGGR